MKLLLFIIGLILVSACQTNQQNPLLLPPSYADSHFDGIEQVDLISEEDIFLLDDDMKELVNRYLLTIDNPQDRTKRLIEIIFHSNIGSLKYNAGANITAREAFHSNSANCLSLTILTYALAKRADLAISFQSVAIPEYWYRDGDYNLLAGHVNLLVKGGKQPFADVIYGNEDMEIDFDPHSIRKHFKKTIITKQQVVAMFYNNIGAQAIVDNEYVKAYAYIKKATTLVPSYIEAWGNLALIYKHNDLYNLAEQTYRYALKMDHDNLNVLDNLSLLLAQTNRKNEANEITAKIASKRQNNPYYFALLADEAFQQQNWREAVKHYKKAVKMSPNEHEFYFGLAKTYYQLGDIEQSKQYLVKAMKYNEFFDVEKRYNAKLAFLQSL